MVEVFLQMSIAMNNLLGTMLRYFIVSEPMPRFAKVSITTFYLLSHASSFPRHQELSFTLWCSLLRLKADLASSGNLLL